MSGINITASNNTNYLVNQTSSPVLVYRDGNFGENGNMSGGEGNTSIWTNDNSEKEILQNITIDLVDAIGPKREALLKIIPITIVYIIIFVTGTLGNIITCIVITRNKYMHTSTNYYLFNLAVADLLVLVLGLPTETYSFWSAYPYVFGETFCILRTFAAEASTYASILTITGFTVERYIAICHPMKAHAMSTLSRPTRVIVVIWIISGICATPMAMQFGLVYIPDENNKPILESSICNVKEEFSLKHSFEIATFLFFFTPMTMILVLYILIGLAVRRSQQAPVSRIDSESQGGDMATAAWKSQQKAKARKAVLKMLVAVVVAFFICWAPFHTQRLLVIYAKDIDSNEKLLYLYKALFYISGVLYYVSSTINPILYNIMSLKFREAFKNTILSTCRPTRKRPKEVKYKFDSRYNVTETHYSYMDQSPTQMHSRTPRNNVRCTSPCLLNEQRIKLCSSDINIRVTATRADRIELDDVDDYVSFEDLRAIDEEVKETAKINGDVGSVRSLRVKVVETTCTLDIPQRNKVPNGSPA
ncbi:pyrokinin-1 receptor-like [Tubulanus polymorphus]|uniref:pyrokinin-1 receptor-like n=1 Tax=Tubulanus polymorphus TaxID=672921 RepID=UPI003DA51113